MSKYGDALDAMDQESSAQSQSVLQNAQQYNPDQYAQALVRSQETGAPAVEIYKNPIAYKSKYGAALDEMDAPTTHEWVKNPDNAAVAHDDIENLTALEKVIGSVFGAVLPADTVKPFAKSAGHIVSNLPTSVAAQVGQMASGSGEFSSASNTEIADAAIASYKRRLARLKPGTPEYDQQLEVIADAEQRREVAQRDTAFAASKASEFRALGQSAIRPNAGPLERGIQQGVAGAAVTLPSMMLLGPEAALPILSLGSGGDRYSDVKAQLIEKGIDEAEASKTAAGSAAISTTAEYVTELIPGHLLVKNVPGFWKKALEFMAAELPGENIAALTQLLDDYRVGLKDDVTASDVLTTMRDTSIATLFGGATQLTAAQIVQRLADRTNQVADLGGKPEEVKTQADELHAAAQESKLATRSPEKLEELVAEMKKQSGSEHVYIEPEAFRTLFQSDQEAADAAAELTGSPQTYYEAAVSGSRIAVPIEKYVTKIATNKDALKILESVSFSPDALTPNETKESREAFDARVKEIGSEEPPASNDASQVVFDDVIGQLIASGMERSTAEKNAALMQSVFRTLAARSGKDVQALYQKYGLRIGRPEQTTGQVDAVLDPLIDQLRAGKIPTEEQAGKALEAGDVRAMDRRASLVQLSDMLEKRGIDLKTTDNQAVKQAIKTQFDQADKSNHGGGTQQTGVDLGRGQSSRNTGTAADQVGQRTVAGSKPADGWQEATRIRGKSGKPLRLYRGASRSLSSKDFTDEALGKATGHPSSGLGVFFSTQREDAASYGDVTDSFLDIRKPKLIKIENVPDFESIDEAIAFREKLKADGHDGIVIQSSHIGGPNQVIAFAPEQVIPETTLEQRYEETKRGAISFGADRQFTINLFEKADLSTFLHESGHFYLEVLGDLATEDNAPQQVKDDYDALLKWFGVESREDIGVEQHEQFARGFESYLMEGKAPSVELQSLFARFRAWLVSVYRTLSRLNVEMTKEVREVMDRLVATDEAIEAVQTQQNYAPVFSNAEQAGMSPEQWSAYKDIATRAHQKSVENLTDEAMRTLKREQNAWYKEERAKVVDDVKTEVNSQPVYQTLAYLQKSTNADGTALPEGIEAAKLDKQKLVDKYGAEFLKRLPRGITKKDGASADIVAQMFGFQSGDAMVEALANARPKKQLIEMEADARMREKYGDVMTDGSMAEEAMKSVHSDERVKVLAAELKALNRKRREVAKFVKAEQHTADRQNKEAREANPLPDREELQAIKAAAERAIAAKKVRDIQPANYRVAEARAARMAFDFAAKGKFEDAYTQKRREIFNHELYRAAVAAREEIDAIVEHMRSFDKRSTRERIAKAKGQYLEQIDALRERFDFSNVSNIADQKRDALAKWVAEQEAAGLEVNVPESLLNESRRTPYKELLLAELQGLGDAVKNIEHLAKTKNKLLKNKAAAEWDAAQSELLERVQSALPEGKEPPLGRFEQSKLARLGEGAKGIADSLLRPETIVEWLDGGTTGPWHDYLWNQANDSQDARERMRDKVAKPLFDLANKITRKRRNELQEMVNIPSMGRALNRRTLISIALNMGNASNLDKLLRGGYRTKDGSTKFTEQNLQEIKNALTKEDWQFIQTVWDTVDQLWPDVVDFQKRMGGLVPEKIEASPIKTRFGEFKGGYFPVVYDPTVSKQGEKQVSGDAVQEIMGQNFTRASTKKGHTKERTKVARPLLLDFERVVTRHMDQVITDLSHREFVLQAMKILDDPELRAQIQNRIGEGAYRSLQGMVRHTVRADGNYGDPAATGWDKTQDYLIRNTAVAALGFRAVTAFGNLVLAPVQAAARISPKQILKGIGEFYRRPREMTAFIHEQSEFMKQRAENMDQTLVETMANLRGERSIRAQVARAAMAVHRWADFLGTHGLWLGKYRQTLEEGGSAEEARREADKAIRQTQTAGAPKDLSAFERDPRYKMFRLFYGPMAIMGNRIREAMQRRGVVKNWPEAFGALMATWFIPAILWELATGKGPDDDDDLKDKTLWALRKEFFYPFMTVPFLRDIANQVERKISGQYAPSRSVPITEAGELLFKAGEEAVKAGKAIAEGDDISTGDLAKDFLRASGPLLGMPSTQLDITGSTLWDIYSGDFDPEGVGDMKYLAIRR